jgi:hypothetical protein
MTGKKGEGEKGKESGKNLTGWRASLNMGVKWGVVVQGGASQVSARGGHMSGPYKKD